ncbi:MAG: 30S ribosomal protein S6e, partial [Thermoprotei archaeon ex4572_64]
HPRKTGERRRKLVRGNVITDHIVQINAVLVYPKDWSEGPVIPLGIKEKKKLMKKEEKIEEQ